MFLNVIAWNHQEVAIGILLKRQIVLNLKVLYNFLLYLQNVFLEEEKRGHEIQNMKGGRKRFPNSAYTLDNFVRSHLMRIKCEATQVLSC